MSIVDEQPSNKYFPNLPVHLKRQGRPFGTRNHLSKTCKENIQAVFDGLGGWESMMNWALFHPSEFYGQVYPRMLANEGVSKGPGSIRVLVYASPSDIPLDEPVADPQPVVVDGVSAHDPTNKTL